MTQQLKQSQTAEPLLFLMVQSSDHITPLTGASPTVTLSKNGAAFGAPAGAVTEVANGWYKVAGNATDTGTLGLLVLHATATSGDPSDAIYQVVGGDPESASVVASSVTGNVGGNVGGSVASVTAGVSLATNDSLIAQAGTAQAGAAGTITLAAGASATDSTYVGEDIVIKSGTGAGQTRTISAYVGSTKVASVTRNWTTTPDNTSVYVVMAGQSPNLNSSLQVALQIGHGETLRQGTAQAGAASTITLDAGASATDNLYQGAQILITSGTGLGQAARAIASYVGSTKVATVAPAWVVTPDSTTGFAIIGLPIPKIDSSQQVVAASVQGNVTGSVASVAGAVGSVTSAVTAGTVSDKTGYSLAADQAVNATKIGGTVQTGRDLGASVLISPGTGTGQLDVTSGVVKANLAQILGTALTETAGQIAAAFKKFFDIASPTSTMNTITAVTTAANLTTNNDKTGYSLAATDSAIAHTGTAQAGTSITITLATGAAAVDSLYKWGTVKIIAGTGAGQARAISQYTGSTRVAIVSWAWAVIPDATSVYVVLQTQTPALDVEGSVTVRPIDTPALHFNTAVTGTASTITLVGSSSFDNVYVGDVIKVYSGQGGGQTRVITAYDSATKIATVDRPWIRIPDNTSLYVILAAQGAALNVALQPTAAAVIADVGITQAGADKVWSTTVRTLSAAGIQAIWDALTSALTTVGSIGKWVVDKLDTTVSSRGTGDATLANQATLLSRADVATSTRLAASSYTAPDNADIVLIKAKTDNLPADPASNTEVDTRLATAGYTVPPSTAAIVTAILDGLLTGHSIADSVAAALRSASSSGDPWGTAVPGAYASGSAGYIVGHNLDTNVGSRGTGDATAANQAAILARTDVATSSRLATAGYTAPDNTDIGLIKAKTDNLPADPASNTEVDTRLATSGYTAPPTPAAIDAEFTGVHGAGTWQQGNTVVPANAAILAAIAAIPAPATVDAIWRDDVVYPDGSKGAELALTSVGGDPLRTDVPGSYPIGSAGYNLGLLATGQVTVISPLSVDGKTLYLIPGMTYQAERGTGILWTLPVGAPDLSGATSYIIDIGYPRKPVLQTACNYSRDGGGVQRLALELTSAQTDSLPDGGGTCAFAIWARWSDSDTDAVPAVTGVAILEKALP